jgi:hypothetical protein
MLIRASFACVVFAFAQWSGSVTANAAEAFVCDKDRVVYVEPGQLEELKRTDPCIASYFGITLQTTAPIAPIVPNSGATPPLELKTLTESASADRFVPGQNYLRRVASLEGPRAPRSAPTAAPGTDFRNVKIINSSDGDGWFRHAQ